MPSWTADNAECCVYTFKEGLFAAVGHDVKLRVQRFALSADRRGVYGTFDATSLVVVCAMADGEERPDALSEGDRTTIEGHVQHDILHASEHPDIRWTTTRMRRDGEGVLRVEGTLELHGRTKPVKATVRPEGDQLVARARIRQPDFGIKPFSALLGALKVKPVVEVELRVPAGGTEQLGTEG